LIRCAESGSSSVAIHEMVKTGMLRARLEFFPHLSAWFPSACAWNSGRRCGQQGAPSVVEAVNQRFESGEAATEENIMSVPAVETPDEAIGWGRTRDEELWAGAKTRSVGAGIVLGSKPWRQQARSGIPQRTSAANSLLPDDQR
jgi:hypothetical protein